ncbi:MAG: sulfatase, partial [Verrucomicrobiota bacterium]
AMPDAITLPQQLRRHGYTCEGYGKIFHNPWPDPRSWDRPHAWGKGSFHHYTPEQQDLARKVRESHPEDSWHRKHLRGVITNDPKIDDAEHSEGDLTRLAVERLQRLGEADKPFFLAVGYTLPHLPWTPPERWWKTYQRESLPLASNPFPPEGAPAVALGTNYELSHYADMTHMPKPAEGSVTDDEARRLRHGYFASVSFIDAQVGRLLDALDRFGMVDDTIVILWSDHGYKLGEHNGWSKMTNYEIDTRIPLIIRDPRAKANGSRCNRLVESIDVYPSVCALTGVPVPDGLDGKSVARLLNQPTLPHKDAAFSQYIWKPRIGNAIRTDRWRYVEWRDLKSGKIEEQELYDHRSDPDENRNVVK